MRPEVQVVMRLDCWFVVAIQSLRTKTDHTVESRFRLAHFVPSKASVFQRKLSIRTKQQLALLLLACVVSIGITWPVLRDGHSIPLSILAMLTTILSLVSLSKVGSAKKTWRRFITNINRKKPK